jgi:rRNA-processing protein FCF1
MEIIIDTNFAVTCTKQKIDFFNLAEEIINQEIVWILPEEVLNEIKIISESKFEKVVDRKSAKLFLDMLEEIPIKNIEKIRLNNKNVDNGLVNFCLKNEQAVLATLDKALKKRIKNNILTISQKKFLRIIKN